MKKLSLVFLLLIIGCQLSALPVHAADESLKIAPAISDLQLTPGKKTSFDLTVENTSDKPIGIHADVTGFDDGSSNFISEKPSPIINWTKLSNSDFILEPSAKKAITVTISPPQWTNNGGFYEAIFLTPFISQQQIPGKPIVLSRIGALIFATVGRLNYNDLYKKVAVSDFRPTSYFFDNNQVTLNFSVKNNYFTHFSAKPFLTISPLLKEGKTELLEENHIFPGKSRNFKINETMQGIGFYTASLAVSIGQGKQLHATTWFVILPYKQILQVLLTVLILCVLLFGRKRIKKAINVLFENKK